MGWFRKPSSTPLWQDDFPVFTADERYVTRRQFTKFLTLTSFGMFVGNLWILVRSFFQRTPSFPRQPIASVGELPVGGVKTFAYPDAADPCILVRTAENSWAAYSQKCTHLSCAVFYEHGHNRLACPCHQGFFSISDGAVLQGPPSRPLPRVALEIHDGQLIATGMATPGESA
jgi:nitrite reductase/ring-hydroxylating ferredoxin subunit